MSHICTKCHQGICKICCEKHPPPSHQLVYFNDYLPKALKYLKKKLERHNEMMKKANELKVGYEKSLINFSDEAIIKKVKEKLASINNYIDNIKDSSERLSVLNAIIDDKNFVNPMSIYNEILYLSGSLKVPKFFTEYNDDYPRDSPKKEANILFETRIIKSIDDIKGKYNKLLLTLEEQINSGKNVNVLDSIQTMDQYLDIVKSRLINICEEEKQKDKNKEINNLIEENMNYTENIFLLLN